MNPVNRNWSKTLVLLNQLALKKFKTQRVIYLNYLNEGVGEPWAGHVREIPNPADILKADKSTIDENFGLADPIGSNFKTQEVWSQNMTVSECATWMLEQVILVLDKKEQCPIQETF